MERVQEREYKAKRGYGPVACGKDAYSGPRSGGVRLIAQNVDHADTDELVKIAGEANSGR